MIIYKKVHKLLIKLLIFIIFLRTVPDINVKCTYAQKSQSVIMFPVQTALHFLINLTVHNIC